MLHRRFGRTELAMPVFSCGGMRYQQSWEDLDEDRITSDSQTTVAACIERAVELGISHIETARGYGSSERQLGQILPALPRDRIIVQTKVPPKSTAKEFLEGFEASMARLRLERVDLLGIHGINNSEVLAMALGKGGPLPAMRKLQKEGRVGHIGFSTHGPPDIIVEAIESDEFDYVNLHWFYVEQHKYPAIEAAARHDMGVFIISPSDKGGKLYAPSDRLVELCRPFTPMGFNDLFCLADSKVHTLSIGASRATDFDAHVAVVPDVARAGEAMAPVLARLEAEKRRILGDDWVEHWEEGIPKWEDVPGEVNVYHTLRLWGLWQAFDMLDFARMRYNLLGSGGHWFPGMKVSAMDWERLPACIAGSPFADRLPDILREAHAAFGQEDAKRLSESE